MRWYRCPLFILWATAAPTLLPGQEPEIDTLALRAHTYFLAQDALAGRATGTPGEAIAAHYIARQCQRLGLAGVGGGYLHPVALEELRVLDGTLFTVRAAGRELSFTFPTDVTPGVGTKAALVGFAGRAVYVGDENAILAGQLRDRRPAGAVAVTAGTVGVAAADSLRDRGVVGMVHLVGDTGTYQLYARSRGERRLYHADPTVGSSLLPSLPSVIVGPRAVQALVAAGSLAGTGPAVEFAIAGEHRRTTAHNVACLLPGSVAGARDTAIAFTAHFDHLGVGPPDERSDSIYNGFSDNAAGVAMLLAITDAMRRQPKPMRHSVLFLFFTGEERGLLGSDAYVHGPAWPLERTAAVINLDAGAPPAPPATWRLAGVDTSGLGAVALAVARAHGWTVTTSPARANSDHFPFVRNGVPAVLIIPGPGPYEGLTSDSSNALRRRWDRYHRADDEWAENFPFGGLARYGAYAYQLAQAVDRDGIPPQGAATPAGCPRRAGGL